MPEVQREPMETAPQNYPAYEDPKKKEAGDKFWELNPENDEEKEETSH